MKSHLYHLQINIDFKNVEIYKSLFSFLEWSVILEEHDVVGFKSGEEGNIWFYGGGKLKAQDYDKLGLNHLAIRVSQKEDVNKCVTFLKSKKIDTLFDTPRHRPEFASGEGNTYYQIMFKTKDNILFEIVYIGAK